MSKEKVTIEDVATNVVDYSKGKEWVEMPNNGTGITCSCSKGDTVLQGKVLATKLTLIDKIKEGIDNGHNCDYICQLSKIYSNLSF